jgi:hypothetical protein
MTDVSYKVVEKIKTHILCSVTYFQENLAVVFEIMCKNIVEPDRPQMPVYFGACPLHAG